MVRREAGSTAPDPAPRITAPPPVDGIVTPEPGPVLDLSDSQPTPTKRPDRDTVAQSDGPTALRSPCDAKSACEKVRPQP